MQNKILNDWVLCRTKINKVSSLYMNIELDELGGDFAGVHI